MAKRDKLTGDLFAAGLYRGGHPFVEGSDTSEEAAERIAESVAGLRRQILFLIYRDGPITCDAVEVLMRGRHQTISARIRELVQMGFVEDTGLRAETRSGRNARLYVVTPAGAGLAGQMSQQPEAQALG
jgi:predicted ArsR family transcriptional regulator